MGTETTKLRSEPPEHLEVQAASRERLPASAGRRVQATLAAADRAAEEILEAARTEARERVAEVESAALERTDGVRRQADTLLARIAELTEQADALGAATRELVASMRAEISIEADGVVDVELAESRELDPGAPPAGGDPAAAGGRRDVPTELEEDASGVDGAGDGRPSTDADAPLPGRRRRPFGWLRGRRARRRSRGGAPAMTLTEVTERHRTLARAMLVYGLDEGEVERRLAETLGVSNPDVILESLQADRNGDTATEGER